MKSVGLIILFVFIGIFVYGIIEQQRAYRRALWEITKAEEARVIDATEVPLDATVSRVFGDLWESDPARRF